MSHRLTIRLDDALWEGFQAFVQLHGVSVTAFLQANMEAWLLAWDQNGRRSFERQF